MKLKQKRCAGLSSKRVPLSCVHMAGSVNNELGGGTYPQSMATLSWAFWTLRSSAISFLQKKSFSSPSRILDLRGETNGTLANLGHLKHSVK